MSTRITFFTTNDIHGRFLGENGAIDFSRLATLKKMYGGALLIDAGDATQGTPLAIAKMGLYPIQIMNKVGYDILTIGNHEFDNITKDEGTECELDKIVEEFQGMYLSQNLFFCEDEESKEKKWKKYIGTLNTPSSGDGGIVPLYPTGRHDQCVLFFGFATPDMSMDIECMKNFRIGEIEDTVKELREEIERIKSGHEILAIVAVAHLGSKGETKSDDLARCMPEIDLIIDGHSHEEYIKKAENGKTTIVQTGCYGKNFGKIQLIIEDDGTTSVEAELFGNDHLSNIEQDKDVRALLDKISGEVEEEFGQVCASSTNCTLWGGALDEKNPYVLGATNIARYAETNLGKLVATVIIECAVDEYEDEKGPLKSEFMIGAINGGGLRESLAFGKEIRNYELFTVLPSPLQSKNESGYCLFRLTLRTLKKILQNSISSLRFQPKQRLTCSDGRFLNFAGLEFTITYDEKNNKISVSDDIMLTMKTDEPFIEPVHLNMDKDGSQEILFCTSKYIGGGGDGYGEALKEASLIFTGDTALFSLVGNYILDDCEGGTLEMPRINKDITYSGFDFAKPEPAKILVANQDLSPLTSVNVAVRFNTDSKDDAVRFMMTDDKGYITVTPPEGASVLEILALEANNEGMMCKNLYCELYFHTYYMPTTDTMTACCRTFTEEPDIQRALTVFHHTSEATGNSHYSNYVAFSAPSVGYGEFLIYDFEIYVLHYGEKEFKKTKSVKYSDTEPEFTIDTESCTYETWFGNGIYTSVPLIAHYDDAHR